jgi:hypothetical protein
MADTPPGIDRDTKVTILRQIALQRRRQELLLDTLGDAARLAAQQVQDKRIEILERKATPEFSWQSAIFEILLSFIPFSAIAGKFLSTVLTDVVNSVLRTRLGFALFSKSEMGLWLAGATQNMIRQVESQATLNDFDKQLAIFGVRQTQSSFLQTENVRVFYSDFVNKLSDGNALLATATQVHSSLEKIGHWELKAEDTPGVAVADLALTFVRRQKAAQNLVLDSLALEVQNDLLDAEQAISLAEFLFQGNAYLDRVIQDLELLKIRAARFLEMAIWNRFYPDVNWSSGQGADPQLTGVADKLSDYFISRFLVPDSTRAARGPAETLTYAQFYRTKAEAVIHLGRDWNELTQEQNACQEGLQRAFRRVWV